MRICDPKSLRVTTSFTLDNPLVAKFAEKNAARLVTGISNETKKALRTLIAQSFDEGIPVGELSRMIRPMIGLTKNQTTAVLNARKSWQAAGVEKERLAKLVTRYATKLLRKRSIAIARTESIYAAAQGQLAAWKLSEKNGVILAEKTLRIWLPDANACERCRYIADQGPVKFNDPFITQDGKRIMTPPLHPHCECSVGLKFAK